MKVTIKDVAIHSGVHPSTVSRVFSGKAKISEETRQRVIATAGQLNFHPNVIARSLTTQRTQTLGMVIPHTQEEFFLDIFFPQVMQGLLDVAYAHDYQVILAGVDFPEHEPKAAMQMIRSKQVDGMVVQASRVGVDTADVLLAEHLPFVLLGRPVHDLPEISWIEIDAQRATLEATRYLVSLGHHEIGFIGGRPNMVVTQDRFRGYQEALQEANLAIQDDLVAYSEFNQEGGYRAMCRFIALGGRRPTAVFCANDLIAIGAMQALQETGLVIPRDCSILSSNDSPMAAVINPGLTSLHAPYRELAREAAQALIEQIRDPTFAPVKKLLPCDFIVRESVSPPVESPQPA